MARQSRRLTFDQKLDALRGHGSDVSPCAGVTNGMTVSKGGVAAVLVTGTCLESASACLSITPGILVRGEIARLLDRGYQKFIRSAQYELPATAAQLHAIHTFTEELNQITGALGLYNESLGTTSDVYQYDRLRGREGVLPKPLRLWELADSH